MVEAVHKRITLSGHIFAGQRRLGAGALWGKSRRSDSDLGDFSDRAKWLVITGILFAKAMLLKLIPGLRHLRAAASASTATDSCLGDGPLCS